MANQNAEKIEHKVDFYANKTTAVLKTVDKLAEEKNEVREYITVIHDRNQTKNRFIITNRYNEEDLEIEETTYCTDYYDHIEEAIQEMKEANRDALIEFREG